MDEHLFKTLISLLCFKVFMKHFSLSHQQIRQGPIDQTWPTFELDFFFLWFSLTLNNFSVTCGKNAAEAWLGPITSYVTVTSALQHSVWFLSHFQLHGTLIRSTTLMVIHFFFFFCHKEHVMEKWQIKTSVKNEVKLIFLDISTVAVIHHKTIHRTLSFLHLCPKDWFWYFWQHLNQTLCCLNYNIKGLFLLIFLNIVSLYNKSSLACSLFGPFPSVIPSLWTIFT